MKIEIIKKIRSLPPLNETALDVIEFNKADNKESEELIEIVQKDPLIVATLLKVANSALFGFRHKVESIENLIQLLGSDFVVSLVIGNSIQNNFDTNFEPYTINSNQFRESSCLYTSFLNIWLAQIDNELKKKLYLSIFLSDIGKCVLANEINHNQMKNVFLEQVKQYPLEIEKTEKDLCGFSSTEVTVLLLENWGLDAELIENIKFIYNINNAPEDYKKAAQVQNIIKTICNLTNPLDEKYIQEGLKKAEQFGFEKQPLAKTIEKVKKLIEEKED
jgi:HD-like signal output (HDOD) protein